VIDAKLPPPVVELLRRLQTGTNHGGLGDAGCNLQQQRGSTNYRVWMCRLAPIRNMNQELVINRIVFPSQKRQRNKTLGSIVHLRVAMFTLGNRHLTK
jgi:hypothetical protein